MTCVAASVQKPSSTNHTNYTECENNNETGRVSSLGGHVTLARAGLCRYKKLGWGAQTKALKCLS